MSKDLNNDINVTLNEFIEEIISEEYSPSSLKSKFSLLSNSFVHIDEISHFETRLTTIFENTNDIMSFSCRIDKIDNDLNSLYDDYITDFKVAEKEISKYNSKVDIDELKKDNDKLVDYINESSKLLFEKQKVEKYLSNLNLFKTALQNMEYKFLHPNHKQVSEMLSKYNLYIKFICIILSVFLYMIMVLFIDLIVDHLNFWTAFSILTTLYIAIIIPVNTFLFKYFNNVQLS